MQTTTVALPVCSRTRGISPRQGSTAHASRCCSQMMLSSRICTSKWRHTAAEVEACKAYPRRCKEQVRGAGHASTQLRDRIAAGFAHRRDGRCLMRFGRLNFFSHRKKEDAAHNVAIPKQFFRSASLYRTTRHWRSQTEFATFLAAERADVFKVKKSLTASEASQDSSKISRPSGVGPRGLRANLCGGVGGVGRCNASTPICDGRPRQTLSLQQESSVSGLQRTTDLKGSDTRAAQVAPRICALVRWALALAEIHS